MVEFDSLILLEDGAALLLEIGDNLILESGSPIVVTTPSVTKSGRSRRKIQQQTPRVKERIPKVIEEPKVNLFRVKAELIGESIDKTLERLR